MTRFFLWCASVDPAFVGDRVVERARYVGSGLALVLTAMVAGAGMTLLLLPVVGDVTAIVPAAVLWALLIFNIDRLLVSNFHYGPLDTTNTGTPPKQRAGTRVVTYGARLLLAVIVAFAVTEPMMIWLFRTEVDQQLATDHEREVKDAEARVRKRLEPQRADINAALGKAQAEADTAAAEAVATKKAADDEESGRGGTGVPGCDPAPEGACMTKRRAAQTAQDRKEKADAALLEAKAKHTTDIDKWHAQVAAEVKSEKEKILGNNGFLASAEALDKVVAAHPALWVRRIVFTLLLLIVDLLPVLIKLFGPPTLHDWFVRKRAAADVVVEDESLAMDTVRRRLRIEKDRHTSQMEHDLAVKDVELYHEREMRRIEYEHQLALRELAFQHGETQVGPDQEGGAARQEESRPPDQLVLNERWVVTTKHPHDSDVGGMGETFVAYDIDKPSFEVVAKRFRQAVARNTAQRDILAARFEKELTRHSAVKSKHVAPVVDKGVHPEFGTFIVTRYYPDTLARRLRPPVDPREAFTPTLEWSLRMTSQVLQGLVDCWRSGIIHLDIKPANVALDHSDVVKLIDFGLAKVAVGPGTGTSGFPGYTLFYAAPEQIEQRPKKGWATSACDVRATGATLYEILTGQAPMEREAAQHGLLGDSGVPPVKTKDFLDLVSSTPPIRPGKLLPGLPPIVDDFVMHLLQPDRRDRPLDVTVAAAELDEVTRSVAGTEVEYLPVGWAHVREGA